MRRNADLIFTMSKPGRRCADLPPMDVPETTLSDRFQRKEALPLPEIAEVDLLRHYMELSRRANGVDNLFYPLGSCTMKYNPRINEDLAALPGFTDIHPLQPEHTVKGALEVLHLLETYLCEVTGMDKITLQPAAGAHGEWTGLNLIKAYHAHNQDFARTKILVPDSAHGTNPASAAMAGFDIVSVPSNPDGSVDTNALRELADEQTAGLMLTNPNTLGLFEKNIVELAEIVHEAGGLLYYDGANFNAIMGLVRPGDMGFDIIHLNLHKTFSTPHGGGGPGSGPVGCKEFLAAFLPAPVVTEKDGDIVFDDDRPESIGKVKAFYGNFLVCVKALSYILNLGGDGLKNASEMAVLNANYMMEKLKSMYTLPYAGPCMHEFVLSAEQLKKETTVSALDVAKGLLDYGIHPPTIYFPLIVHEALMIEPTETESKETLDEAIAALSEIYQTAKENPAFLHEAPISTVIRRVDEVGAARNPVLKYDHR